jgi:hypothetical protein
MIIFLRHVCQRVFRHHFSVLLFSFALSLTIFYVPFYSPLPSHSLLHSPSPLLPLPSRLSYCILLSSWSDAPLYYFLSPIISFLVLCVLLRLVILIKLHYLAPIIRDTPRLPPPIPTPTCPSCMTSSDYGALWPSRTKPQVLPISAQGAVSAVSSSAGLVLSVGSPKEKITTFQLVQVDIGAEAK